MKSVKVNKQELLTKIKANREKHLKDYEELVRDFWTTAEARVENLLERVKSKQGTNFSMHENLPDSHKKDYDRAIEMLEMEVDAEVTIDQKDFARYVQDDWEWKHQFDMLKGGYAASANNF